MTFPTWRMIVRTMGAFLLLFPIPSMTVATPAAPKSDSKPDFSAITTRDQAEALVRQGKLVNILLFPAELGGEDRPDNSSFITPASAQTFSMIVGTLKRFTAEGLVNKLDVQPEYRGQSLIPARIAFHATHSRKKGGFHPVVEIW